MLQFKSKINQESSNDMGYSIIEVLIAMVIFSFGILSIYTLQIASIKSNALGRAVTLDANLAIDRVEKLMSLAYSDADLAAGVHSVAAGSFTQATDGIDNNNDGEVDELFESGPISIAWTVQDDFPDTNTKSIAVTVFHSMSLRPDRSITFNFIKANL